MRAPRVLAVLACLAIGAAALPVSVPSAGANPTGDPNWPMFRDDPAHHGANVVDPSLSPSTVSRLSPVWRAQVGTGYASPAVVGTTVYTTALTSIVALDAATGKVRWTYDTGNWTDASPAVVGGVVYGYGDRQVVALDAATGKVRWTTANGGGESPPTVRVGTVYIGSNDGFVYALDARTGAARWRFGTGDRVVASPAVTKGRVVVPSNDGYLYALDAATGQLRWRTQIAGGRSSPTISDDLVIVGGSGQVHGIDLWTGRIAWTFQAGGSVHSSPAVVDGVVYVGSDDGNLYALARASGRLRWASDVSRDPGEIVWSSPAVARGVVYVATSAAMVAVRATDGRVLWTDRTVGTYASPAVKGGRVYVHADGVTAFAVPT